MTDGIRFCGHDDVMQVGGRGRVCKWEKNTLVYGFKATVPEVTKDQIVAISKVVWKRWASVCDIRASHVKDANTAADIIISSRKFDGPGGTLAQAALPCSGRGEALSLELDLEERWSILDVPASQQQISLSSVLFHEFGHNLGIEHGPKGNMMAPYIQHGLYLPQEWDAQQAVLRYGPPTSVPDLPPTPTPEEMVKVTFTLPKDNVTVQ